MAETQRTSGQAGQNSSQAPLSFYRNLELSLPRLICHFLAQETATAADHRAAALVSSLGMGPGISPDMSQSVRQGADSSSAREAVFRELQALAAAHQAPQAAPQGN